MVLQSSFCLTFVFSSLQAQKCILCFIIERQQISAWNLVLYLWLLQPMPGPLTQQELGRWREQGGEAGLQLALWDSKTKCSGAGWYLLGLEKAAS